MAALSRSGQRAFDFLSIAGLGRRDLPSGDGLSVLACTSMNGREVSGKRLGENFLLTRRIRGQDVTCSLDEN